MPQPETHHRKSAATRARDCAQAIAAITKRASELAPCGWYTPSQTAALEEKRFLLFGRIARLGRFAALVQGDVTLAALKLHAAALEASRG